MTLNDLLPPTVLIIDDDRINRTALAELLQNDCRLLLAKDGPSGLEILEREHVALVLLDVSMPGMDGYEVLGRMRTNPHTKNIAVIFITGMSEDADEERGLLLGAADYVQKPIRPAIVRARVSSHLKLVMQRRALERQALQDGLTGIANRRYFDEVLEHSIRHAAREHQSLGVALFDVDHFKQYNDFYGHVEGDEALKQVAFILSDFARRPGDLAARYGGEEFVLLMPATDQLAQQLKGIRNALLRCRLPHARSSTSEFLTLSCGGIVVWPDHETSAQSLLERADKLLYKAKQQGRNQVQVEVGTPAHMQARTV